LNKFNYTLSKINYKIYGAHGVEWSWSGNGVEIKKISEVGVEMELDI
jgi:hypothetical protein